ncbi:hypothetical protein JW977_02270 [Candidatus Falkowbacteria bacterium]|nr:hypothetical protein [Candidatus Falkowbacteria bacterium]
MSKLRIEETCNPQKRRSIETIVRNLGARFHAKVAKRKVTNNEGKINGTLILVLEAPRKHLKAIKLAIKQDERFEGVPKFV